MKVDFLVRGRQLESALLTLSSANSATAHSVATEVFRRWYDLDDSAKSKQRVTVFDDRYDTYRPEDLKRLRDTSDAGGKWCRAYFSPFPAERAHDMALD